MNIPCPHCEDGTIWRSRYGGNDPDVWPVPCPHCDATGEIIQYCEAWRCTAEATTLCDGDYYCAKHAAELVEDA